MRATSCIRRRFTRSNPHEVSGGRKFSRPAVHALRAAHFDVAWVAEDERAIDDETVLARSNRESRVLLTFDKDFGELAFRRRVPAHAGVVLFRLPDQSLEAVVRIVMQAISSNHGNN